MLSAKLILIAGLAGATLGAASAAEPTPETGLLLGRVSIYEDKGQYDNALADLAQAAQLSPGAADVYLSRGRVLARMGAIERSLAEINRIPEFNRWLEAADTDKVGSADRLGQYDRTITYFSQIIAKTPRNADALRSRGGAHLAYRRYDLAIQDFDRAIELKSDAFAARGATYFKLGQFARAIQDLDQAIRLKPNDAAALKNRGSAYRNMGQQDRAIADYGEAMRLDPQNAAGVYSDAVYFRGHAHRLKGQFDRAVADYGEAIRLNANDGDAFSSRCFVRAVLGDHSSANRDCNQAMRLQPGQAAPQANFGFNLHKQSILNNAILYYNRALAITPNLAGALFARGIAKRRLGDSSAGNADISAAEQIQPNIAEEYALYGIKR